MRKRLDPLLLELQEQVRLDFAAEFPQALRDDLKEELALSLEALVIEAYLSAKPPHPEWLHAD